MKFSGKRVTVFGMGRSGISALNLLKMNGADVWAVNSGKIETWKDKLNGLVDIDRCVEQSNSSKYFEASDLIILSPGIPGDHQVLDSAIKKGVPIWSEIELGFKFAKVPIIAITGTNGKTTTVSMIADMLVRSGHTVFTGGNIGTPFCDYAISDKDYEFILLELSSFQLETIIEFRPSIAAILNLFPNHGERYADFDDYAKAKFNITGNMKSDDHIVFPDSFGIIEKWGKKQKLQQHCLSVSDVNLVKEVLSANYELNQFKLHGAHNFVNLYFACQILDILGIEKNGIQKSINRFAGVPHRLQYIDCNALFTPFNDAKSTNWDATNTAVASIEKNGRSLHLILGGKKRGRDDSILSNLDNLRKKVDKVLLIGDTTEMLALELDGKIPFEKCHTIERAILFSKNTNFNGFLLLSPAFPSYDQFQNFEKRGECFIHLLSKL